MPIYLGMDIHEIPEIFLERWTIRETASGDRHFVGFDTVACDGRVSTLIVSFDPRTRKGLTSSGRRYCLLGRAGFDKDGEYVWSRVTRIRKILVGLTSQGSYVRIGETRFRRRSALTNLKALDIVHLRRRLLETSGIPAASSNVHCFRQYLSDSHVVRVDGLGESWTITLDME